MNNDSTLQNNHVLVLDTSQEGTRISVVSGSRVLSYLYCSVRGRHAPALITGIETVLSAAGTTIQGINNIVVCVGPGFFTGVRVGLATAMGISLSRGIPLLGVSSLDILALKGARMYPGAPRREGSDITHIVSVISAGRGMVYLALYRLDKAQGNQIVRDTDFVCSTFEGASQLVCTTSASANKAVLLVGEGIAPLARDMRSHGIQVVSLPELAASINDSLLMVHHGVQESKNEHYSFPKPIYVKRPPVLKPVSRPRSEQLRRGKDLKE